MKILRVFFHEGTRLFANETIGNIDLDNPQHKKLYDLSFNKDARCIRIVLLDGPKKGQNILVPFERVSSIHTAPG